jgi:hypothetical protein
MDQLNWGDDQRTLVRDLIAEEVNKARLSHNFIPTSELGEDARSVRSDKYDSGNNTVDDVTQIPLVEVSAFVSLTRAQATDKDLSSALLLIRRSANKLARAHDAIIFNGQPKADELPPKAKDLGLKAEWGSANGGLFETRNEVKVEVDPAGEQTIGEALVGAVAEAVVRLENAGYIGSYVLILGQTLFAEANTPSTGSMVLPTDRIKNLLELEQDQHVHRSSVLDDEMGVLLSLGGAPMDRAVAINPTFEFLRIGEHERRMCRVFERFALRLKEKDSVIKLILQKATTSSE